MTKTIFAAAALAVAFAGPAFAGDAAKGETVFKKCKSCHEIGEGAKSKTGPALTGIVGAKVGAVPDFKYSADLAEAGAAGKTWTEEHLTAFLTKPKDVYPKTKMGFAGIKDAEDVADLIAYMKAAK